MDSDPQKIMEGELAWIWAQATYPLLVEHERGTATFVVKDFPKFVQTLNFMVAPSMAHEVGAAVLDVVIETSWGKVLHATCRTGYVERVPLESDGIEIPADGQHEANVAVTFRSGSFKTIAVLPQKMKLVFISRLEAVSAG